jgi:hypothetical protein
MGITQTVTDAEILAASILTRRLRKCIAAGDHSPDDAEPHKCPRCGL